jgi:hypothetical protein
MPMQAESLEVLEKASVAPAQARAIVRAIEIEITGAKDTLATKHDVLMLQQRIDALGAELRSDLGGKMDALAGQLRAEMAKLGGDLRAEMAKLGGELHAEIHRAVSGATRQMYLALLGQMTVMLGFFYFFLIQLR